MKDIWYSLEEKEILNERYDLAMSRISEIAQEQAVPADFVSYFKRTAQFLMLCDEVKGRLEKGGGSYDPDQMRSDNHALYEDILPGNYDRSYADPAYACEMLGSEAGRLLCFLYAQLRGVIAYIFEGKSEETTAHMELFVQVYTILAQDFANGVRDKEEISADSVRDALYWFESDYADVILAHRIRENIDPDCGFFTDILMNADLSNPDYLYLYGEYISENEILTARFLNSLPEDEIDRMASTWSEGYRAGFIATGKPLGKKKTVNIRYFAGYERMVRKAVLNFEKMGLRPTIFRCSVSALTGNGSGRNGFTGAVPNPQYDYDHREDAALMLDSRYMERKIDVTKAVYEEYRVMAAQHGGPAVMELFGETPFEPVKKPACWSYDDRQKKLQVRLSSRLSQLTSDYIIGKERSFTIISYPSPQIAQEEENGNCRIDIERYKQLFRETIRVNTLDASLYSRIQSVIIDALDKGTAAHIVGAGKNHTDLTVIFHTLEDPEHETNFENCVADVNIPVGEVFTSPVLKGTNGVLHVTQVYLEGLNFRDLEICFKDGMTESVSCANFDDPKDNDSYIRENILFHHEKLPMGEFAIGTNTTAYAMAQRYNISSRLPILIAEKTGPHFAVGDTCYSWDEDNITCNPDGKRIIARENEISALRKEDPLKAYFGCHTDITIPYEELALIEVVGKDGLRRDIIRDGRFVLPGTEELNAPLDHFQPAAE